MKLPTEHELISFFECYSALLDSEDIPFYYNVATYKYTNKKGQNFKIEVSPSSDKMKILVKQEEITIANLELNQIEKFEILKDDHIQKRIMLINEKFAFKLTFHPVLQIQYTDKPEI